MIYETDKMMQMSPTLILNVGENIMQNTKIPT